LADGGAGTHTHGLGSGSAVGFPGDTTSLTHGTALHCNRPSQGSEIVGRYGGRHHGFGAFLRNMASGWRDTCEDMPDADPVPDSCASRNKYEAL
jgi:hypothetical protein